MKQIDMSKWPAPLIRLYLGELTQEAVLAAADDPDAARRKADSARPTSMAANWYYKAAQRMKPGGCCNLRRLTVQNPSSNTRTPTLNSKHLTQVSSNIAAATHEETSS